MKRYVSTFTVGLTLGLVLAAMSFAACGGNPGPNTTPQTVEGKIADYGTKVITVAREVRGTVETFHTTGIISTDDTRVVMTTLKHVGVETQRLAGVLTEMSKIRAAGGQPGLKAEEVRQIIASIRSLITLVPDQVGDIQVKVRLQALMDRIGGVLTDLSGELTRWIGV